MPLLYKEGYFMTESNLFDDDKLEKEHKSPRENLDSF